jgi:hypothetical protein
LDKGAKINDLFKIESKNINLSLFKQGGKVNSYYMKKQAYEHEKNILKKNILRRLI